MKEGCWTNGFGETKKLTSQVMQVACKLAGASLSIRALGYLFASLGNLGAFRLVRSVTPVMETSMVNINTRFYA